MMRATWKPAGGALLAAALLSGEGAAEPDLNQLLSEMSDRVSANVVSVHAVRALPGESGEPRHGRCVGTGVLLENGYVATTLSVAGPGDEITLRFGDGRTTGANVIGVSPLRELVLLDPAEDRSGGLPFGDPESLHAGSWLFVVGYSMNAPEPMLASGRFSSRTILDMNDSSPDTVALLQLEANVFPGNSGAAVIDAEGRFVGMILGGLGSDGFLDPVVLSSFDDVQLPITRCVMTAQPPLGISFALPSSDVRSLVAAVENGTVYRPGYLGIRVEVSEGGLPGVLVSEVVSGSPAAFAGVRPGDVIQEVNGTRIEDPMALVGLVRELEPGSHASLLLTGQKGRAAARQTNVVLGDYTTDYRTSLVWDRLLSGRAQSLADARARLVERLGVLDAELRRLDGLTPLPRSTADAGGR